MGQTRPKPKIRRRFLLSHVCQRHQGQMPWATETVETNGARPGSLVGSPKKTTISLLKYFFSWTYKLVVASNTILFGSNNLNFNQLYDSKEPTQRTRCETSRPFKIHGPFLSTRRLEMYGVEIMENIHGLKPWRCGFHRCVVVDHLKLLMLLLLGVSDRWGFVGENPGNPPGALPFFFAPFAVPSLRSILLCSAVATSIGLGDERFRCTSALSAVLTSALGKTFLFMFSHFSPSGTHAGSPDPRNVVTSDPEKN